MHLKFQHFLAGKKLVKVKMEIVPIKNSVLSVNNHFHKVFKKLIDKKNKNDSIATEIEWISSQLTNETRQICENAANVLVEYGKIFDQGFSLNLLVSSFSRIQNSNFDLIANGIFKLLLESMRNSENYENQFGITNKIHPVSLLISESNNLKMLYLSQKIEETLLDSNK
mgnify:CR=1 FL=1